MSATCETCRYWTNVEADWQFDALRMGKCAAIKQREDIIEPAWAITDWDAREKEEARLLIEAKAVALDGSGYYAALRTTGDFGCVLHEPTPADRKEGSDG